MLKCLITQKQRCRTTGCSLQLVQDIFRALKGLSRCSGIQDSQLQKQTFDPNIRTEDQLQQEADRICQRKLREATVKEGRHKREADELDQQRKQELKRMEDAMIISAPPPDGYPSGIFSIQIHQITGLELENVSKVSTEKSTETFAPHFSPRTSTLCALFCNDAVFASVVRKR